MIIDSITPPPLLPASTVTAEIQRRAAATVRRHARDDADRQALLDCLGLPAEPVGDEGQAHAAVEGGPLAGERVRRRLERMAADPDGRTAAYGLLAGAILGGPDAGVSVADDGGRE